MDTSEKKRSVIVGIFILLGILILVACIFTLGGQQKSFVKSIRIKAIFDDVGGLKIGNNVWFSGVKIGTVKTMTFSGTAEVEITMSIEDEAQKYIHKNARAKVSSEGFIGNKIILIYGGTVNTPSIEDGDRLAVEKALSTDDIMATLQENNKNLLDITKDFKLLSLKIVRGKGTLGAILTDSLMAEGFRSIVSNLQTAAVNTANVSGSVARLTSKINSKGALANELLTDTTVFSSLKTTVAQLQKATASAAEITDNLKKTSDKLSASDNAVGVLLNDEQTASKLKSTVSNLESSTKKLDENMEALQHNFLLRGFFKKKAKEAAKTATP